MENLDFLAKKWQLVTQAPVFAIAGVMAISTLAWLIARSWYGQQIKTLRQRLALAQEKAAVAQDKAVALTQQIESKVDHADLLKTVNSTVAAIDQVSQATQPLPEETRAMLKQTLRDADIPPLTWEPDPDGSSRAFSLYPAMRFLITKEDEKFILFVYGVRLAYA
jgi:hypothetical protein